MKTEPVETKNKLVQTRIRCFPDSPDGITQTIRPVSDRSCQTAASVPPSTINLHFYALLEFIPYQAITEGSIKELDLPRKALLHWKPTTIFEEIRSSAVALEFSEDNSLRGVMKKQGSGTFSDNFIHGRLTTNKNPKMKVEMITQDVQTILSVVPHVLESNELANVYAETSIQTSITCIPGESISNLVPLLKARLLHVPDSSAAEALTADDNSNLKTRKESMEGARNEEEALDIDRFDDQRAQLEENQLGEGETNSAQVNVINLDQTESSTKQKDTDFEKMGEQILSNLESLEKISFKKNLTVTLSGNKIKTDSCQCATNLYNAVAAKLKLYTSTLKLSPQIFPASSPFEDHIKQMLNSTVVILQTELAKMVQVLIDEDPCISCPCTKSVKDIIVQAIPHQRPNTPDVSSTIQNNPRSCKCSTNKTDNPQPFVSIAKAESDPRSCRCSKDLDQQNKNVSTNSDPRSCKCFKKGNDNGPGPICANENKEIKEISLTRKYFDPITNETKIIREDIVEEITRKMILNANNETLVEENTRTTTLKHISDELNKEPAKTICKKPCTMKGGMIVINEDDRVATTSNAPVTVNKDENSLANITKTKNSLEVVSAENSIEVSEITKSEVMANEKEEGETNATTETQKISKANDIDYTQPLLTVELDVGESAAEVTIDPLNTQTSIEVGEITKSEVIVDKKAEGETTEIQEISKGDDIGYNEGLSPLPMVELDVEESAAEGTTIPLDTQTPEQVPIAAPEVIGDYTGAKRYSIIECECHPREFGAAPPGLHPEDAIIRPHLQRTEDSVLSFVPCMCSAKTEIQESPKHADGVRLTYSCPETNTVRKVDVQTGPSISNINEQIIRLSVIYKQGSAGPEICTEELLTPGRQITIAPNKSPNSDVAPVCLQFEKDNQDVRLLCECNKLVCAKQAITNFNNSFCNEADKPNDSPGQLVIEDAPCLNKCPVHCTKPSTFRKSQLSPAQSKMPTNTDVEITIAYAQNVTAKESTPKEDDLEKRSITLMYDQEVSYNEPYLDIVYDNDIDSTLGVQTDLTLGDKLQSESLSSVGKEEEEELTPCGSKTEISWKEISLPAPGTYKIKSIKEKEKIKEIVAEVQQEMLQIEQTKAAQVMEVPKVEFKPLPQELEDSPEEPMEIFDALQEESVVPSEEFEAPPEESEAPTEELVTSLEEPVTPLEELEVPSGNLEAPSEEYEVPPQEPEALQVPPPEEPPAISNRDIAGEEQSQKSNSPVEPFVESGSRRLPQKPLLFEVNAFKANEPYMEGLYRAFPNSDEEDWDECGSTTEIPWKDIVLHQNYKIRKMKKPKKCICKTTASVQEQKQTIPNIQGPTGMFIPYELPPTLFQDSDTDEIPQMTATSISQQSFAVSELNTYMGADEYPSTVMTLDASNAENDNISIFSTISTLRRKAKKSPKEFMFIIDLGDDNNYSISFQGNQGAAPPFGPEAAELHKSVSEPFNVTKDDTGDEPRSFVINFKSKNTPSTVPDFKEHNAIDALNNVPYFEELGTNDMSNNVPNFEEPNINDISNNVPSIMEHSIIDSQSQPYNYQKFTDSQNYLGETPKGTHSCGYVKPPDVEVALTSTATHECVFRTPKEVAKSSCSGSQAIPACRKGDTSSGTTSEIQGLGSPQIIQTKVLLKRDGDPDKVVKEQMQLTSGENTMFFKVPGEDINIKLKVSTVGLKLEATQDSKATTSPPALHKKCACKAHSVTNPSVNFEPSEDLSTTPKTTKFVCSKAKYEPPKLTELLTPTSSNYTDKMTVETFKQDPVMAALEAYEAEMRPLKQVLNQLQEKIRNLNVPEMKGCMCKTTLNNAPQTQQPSMYPPMTIRSRLKINGHPETVARTNMHFKPSLQQSQSYAAQQPCPYFQAAAFQGPIRQVSPPYGQLQSPVMAPPFQPYMPPPPYYNPPGTSSQQYYYDIPQSPQQSYMEPCFSKSSKHHKHSKEKHLGKTHHHRNTEDLAYQARHYGMHPDYRGRNYPSKQMICQDLYQEDLRCGRAHKSDRKRSPQSCSDLDSQGDSDVENLRPHKEKSDHKVKCKRSDNNTRKQGTSNHKSNRKCCSKTGTSYMDSQESQRLRPGKALKTSPDDFIPEMNRSSSNKKTNHKHHTIPPCVISKCSSKTKSKTNNCYE